MKPGDTCPKCKRGRLEYEVIKTGLGFVYGDLVCDSCGERFECEWIEWGLR